MLAQRFQRILAAGGVSWPLPHEECVAIRIGSFPGGGGAAGVDVDSPGRQVLRHDVVREHPHRAWRLIVQQLDARPLRTPEARDADA